MLISHGTADPLVTIEISLDLYDSLCEHWFENQTDLLMIEGSGHGTDEFFQYETKKYVVDFFDKYLKNNWYTIFNMEDRVIVLYNKDFDYN